MLSNGGYPFEPRNINMKFGKNRRKGEQDAIDKKQQARKKILENPYIIEDIFNDQDWQSFEQQNTEHEVPSAKMQAAIEKDIHASSEQESRKERKEVRTRRLIAYAAAASVLLLMTFNLWRWNSEEQSAMQSNRVEQKQVPLTDSGWVVLANNESTDSAVVLADQSKVKLFAHSSIRYRRHFTAHSREIQLDGKAYFAVAKDPSRPFSVYANATKTTALGTSFTIDTRSKNHQTTIKLHSGKVLVASTTTKPAFANIFLDNIGENLLFDASMRLVAHSGKKEIEPKPTKPSAQMEQNSSRIQLDNIPLDDVFAALEKAYNIAIKINDRSIEKIQYTGTIEPEREQVQEVLAVICLINDLRYEVDANGQYHIYKQEQNNTHNTQENL